MVAFAGVPLLTALKWGRDRVSKGWIQTVIAGVPMFEQAPQKRIDGRVWEQQHEGALPNPQFRGVNETYTDSYAEKDSSWWGTTILGGQIKIDIAELDSGVTDDDAEFRAKQYRQHAKSAGMRYSWEFFQGDGTGKGFKGLRVLVNEGWGVVSNTGGDAALSFDQLDLALLNFENGEPSQMLMNKELALRFSHRARSGFTGFTLIDDGTDALGRPVKRYSGIPIRIIRRGRDSAGATVQILPFTENNLAPTGGTTSSIYIVNYDDEAVTGLLGKRGKLAMRNLQESTEGPYEVGRMEFYPGVASFDPFGLVRYNRITNA